MTDSEIIELLDTTHPSGLGRGGFNIRLTHYGGLIYDDNETMILEDLKLQFVNPIGPFKKWVEISATTKNRKNRYWLFCKHEFWSSISEQNAKSLYLVPFLNTLRLFTSGTVTQREVEMAFNCKVSARIDTYNPQETEYFSFWIEQIKQYNPTVYRRQQ